MHIVRSQRKPGMAHTSGEVQALHSPQHSDSDVDTAPIAVRATSWRDPRSLPYVTLGRPVRCSEICACIKIAVLLGTVCMGFLTTCEGLRKGSAVHVVLGCFAVTNGSRVFWQMLHWRREIALLEAVVEMLVLFPGSILVVVYMPLPHRMCTEENGNTFVCVQTHGQGWMLFGGTVLYLAGFCLNVGSEHYMHMETRDRRHLVTTGPYAWMRHPNYFGEILCWTGGVIAGGYKIWIGFLLIVFPMTVGMHLWSVQDIEGHLERMYGEKCVREWKARVPAAIFPSWNKCSQWRPSQAKE